MNKQIKRAFIIAALLRIISVISGIFLGAVGISPVSLIGDFFEEELSKSKRIFLYVRLPRVLGTMLCGASPAVSGTVIQSVLGNPIAAPNIIGVNAGDGFFTVLCLALLPGKPEIVPASASGVNNAHRDYSRVLRFNPVTPEITWQYTPLEAGCLLFTGASIIYSSYISCSVCRTETR